MLHSSQGRVVTAKDINRDFNNSKDRPFWLILTCDFSIQNFYLNQIKTNTNLSVSAPLAGSHISIVRKEKVKFPKRWRESLNKTFKFRYESLLRTNGKHWWLLVESKDLEDLREDFGLSRKPRVPFHLTVATVSNSEDVIQRPLPNNLQNRYSCLLKMREVLPSVIWNNSPEREELEHIQKRFYL